MPGEEGKGAVEGTSSGGSGGAGEGNRTARHLRTYGAKVPWRVRVVAAAAAAAAGGSRSGYDDEGAWR
jgi:hypothetical protein